MLIPLNRSEWWCHRSEAAIDYFHVDVVCFLASLGNQETGTMQIEPPVWHCCVIVGALNGESDSDKQGQRHRFLKAE